MLILPVINFAKAGKDKTFEYSEQNKSQLKSKNQYPFELKPLLTKNEFPTFEQQLTGSN
jgi:hypothetical protein